jgi:hypoxanthine-guanine phosphoribosyltransferase
MLLLQVVLLLVMVMGWSYQMSLTHATRCDLSSSKIGNRQAFEITRNGTLVIPMLSNFFVFQRTFCLKLYNKLKLEFEFVKVSKFRSN